MLIFAFCNYVENEVRLQMAIFPQTTPFCDLILGSYEFQVLNIVIFLATFLHKSLIQGPIFVSCSFWQGIRMKTEEFLQDLVAKWNQSCVIRPAQCGDNISHVLTSFTVCVETFTERWQLPRATLVKYFSVFYIYFFMSSLQLPFHMWRRGTGNTGRQECWSTHRIQILFVSLLGGYSLSGCAKFQASFDRLHNGSN